MIRLPGLIDPHVHFRTPGQEYKEDFLTGTQAALAGGYTTVIDMPNNTIPITTLDKLNEKISLAKKQIVCDIGFYFGSLGNNVNQFPLVQNRVLGLKIYLNQTTGGFIVDEVVFRKICEAWPKNHPIVVHAEANVISSIIEVANQTNQRLHVAHISSQIELQTVIDAKMKGYKVTCGVTPHHVFMTSQDTKEYGAFAMMKPTLKSPEDVAFLWNHLSDIDLIESDHAPHTLEEKQSANPPFGVTGLETTVVLLLTAAGEGKLTITDIKRLCSDSPAKIFGITQDATTIVEIDETEKWTVVNEKLFTKCKLSPFNGRQLKGKVKRVFIRGNKVFEDGKILVNPGFGEIIS